MQIGSIEVRDLAAKYGTPLYVYDFAQIQANAIRLKQAFHSDKVPMRIFYAMKANSHPAILELMRGFKFGIDCVSPGELEIALKVGFVPRDILYTGNYESLSDLQAAYRAGILLNLDDISSLTRLLRIGCPSLLSFRINPGEGRGKYHQITTAGKKAKFGIPAEKAASAYAQAKAAGVRHFGAHMMTGSGILEADYFPNMLSIFLDILKEVAQANQIEFDFIDMGGGLGIPYYGDEHELDIEQVGIATTRIFAERTAQYKFGKPTLIIEPGRYLVGNAGYLISRILGIKHSYRTFVGLDAGFNTLIRPALYGARHPIIVDGKENASELFPVNLCGQICENTDIFATDYPLPSVQEGDLLIFKQVGAYGSVMAMPYNHRLRPAEVAILDGRDLLITRREEMTDYWARITYPILK